MNSVFSESVDAERQFCRHDPIGYLVMPISFFNSVHDNGSKGFFGGLNGEIPWRDLCKGLENFASIPFAHKAEAPLFAPTVFAGTRREKNATRSALAVIDADGGFEYGSAVEFLTEHEIEAILYTTASNQDGSRFRIMVPLFEPVDPETQKAVVKAVCTLLKPGWKPDTSKNNCYSLFYVPGRYAGAQNEFAHVKGSIFSAEAWLQLAKEALSNGHAMGMARNELKPTATTWNSSFDCLYVDQAWVREYLDLPDDFYNGLYGFMCRVGLSAMRQGIKLDPTQLADLARDVEGLSGRKHASWDVETRDLESEAANALDFARGEIARTPSPSDAKIERCGTATGESFADWMMREDTADWRHPRETAKTIVDSGDPLEWDAGLDDRPIEPRQWLLGNTFCRRYVSTIVADGGTGKTALRVAQAIALATGRPITGEHVFQRCRVLYVTLEDDGDEMRRRIKACRLHHGIARDELRDHLFVVALANGPKLALSTKGGGVETGDLGKLLAEIIERRQIDVVVLDPFIKAHGCDENNNNAIDRVAGMLADMAFRFNVAVDAPHHVAKGMSDPGNANRGRGASAFKDAARLVYTLSKMTAEEAKTLGLDDGEKWRYVRVDSAKVNIAPNAATATWFKLVGVPLGNGDDAYPSGDEVQTVEPWTPVDPMILVGDDDLREAILAEIGGAPSHALYSAHANSGQRHVLTIFQRHLPDITRRQAERIIDAWITGGLLQYVEFKDNKSRDRKGLAVGEA